LGRFLIRDWRRRPNRYDSELGREGSRTSLADISTMWSFRTASSARHTTVMMVVVIRMNLLTKVRYKTGNICAQISWGDVSLQQDSDTSRIDIEYPS